MTKRIKETDTLCVVPDEVLLETVSFLQPKEACGLRRVCHRFNNLLSTEIGLKTIIAVCQKYSDEIYEKNLLKLVDELHKEHVKFTTLIPDTEENDFYEYYEQEGDEPLVGAYGSQYSFVENGIQKNPDGTMSSVYQNNATGREYSVYGILENDMWHDRETDVDGFDVVKIGGIDYLIET